MDGTCTMWLCGIADDLPNIPPKPVGTVGSNGPTGEPWFSEATWDVCVDDAFTFPFGW